MYCTCSPSDENTEPEEIRQLKYIKSLEFYEYYANEQLKQKFKGKIKRKYFYHIDLQGRLFLEDTIPKNIATSLKSPKFLNFFWRLIRHNPNYCNQPITPNNTLCKDNNFHTDYPYISRCGNEMNYIKVGW